MEVVSRRQTRKEVAVFKIVQELKDTGFNQDEITARLVASGHFDEDGNLIVEGIEDRGFQVGNKNDFYRYIKRAKDHYFDTAIEISSNSNDPIWMATKTVRDQLEAEAKHKLELVREEYQEKLDDKEIEIAAFKKTCAENQKQLEEFHQKISALESEREALKLERAEQHDMNTKLQAENASLKVAFDDLKSQSERHESRVAEYKQELESRFKLETEKVQREAAESIKKAEGMSSHWAMEFDRERDAHKKTKEERALYKRKADEFEDRVDFLERDNQFQKGELTRIKTELTVAKGDQIEKGIAQYESKIIEKLDAVQTESMERETKLNESIHSFIYSPLKEILEKVVKLESQALNVIDE